MVFVNFFPPRPLILGSYLDEKYPFCHYILSPVLPFYSFNLFIKTVVTVLQYHSWKIFYNKVFAYFKNDNASELLVIFSFLFLPNLSFLTLIFFYLPTLPIVNFNPLTVFILVKWLKFGFINSCPQQSP